MSKPLNIMHLSDLHFGRIDQTVLERLKIFLVTNRDHINLFILTGDLTQRARSHEFMAASEFLKTLEKPLFLVPGNHDIPLYNLYQRLFSPYKKFLKFFQPHSQNFYEDEQVAIFGLWSTNSLTVSKGKIKDRDLETMKSKFQHIPEEKIRIIASHHPIFSETEPMSRKVHEQILNLKPHLVLSGHEHYAQVRHLSQDSSLPICISSGTSTSTRLRTQSNGFNMITVDAGKLSVDIYQYDFEKNEFLVGEQFRSTLRKVEDSDLSPTFKD